MNKQLASLALGLAVVGGAQAAIDEGRIHGQYIVTVDAAQVSDISSTVQSLLAGIPGSQLLFEYDTVLQGFAVRMDATQAQLLAQNPLVKAIEQDHQVVAFGTQTNATWGLDRVDQEDLPLDGSYTYPASAGSSAHVYVIDTGINPDHAEFTGRVGASRNFVSSGLFFAPDPDAWQDCEGHGTHVASTAMGTTWGVAKSATVHAVRVLDCLGSGSGSAIIAGMEWVAENAEKPAVANLSLGTLNGRSSAQEEAARNLYAAGVLPVVAAGNDSANACNTSPAAEPLALTVASSDSADRQSSFSNHGSCVDIYAPGSSIRAADHNSNTGSKLLSGTSMAAPHVAGAVAIELDQAPSLNAAQVTDVVIAQATPGTLTQVSAGTPNLLLYVPADGGGSEPVDQPPVAAFDSTCDALSCSFDASASSDDGTNLAYAWDFGDGNVASEVAVSHSFGSDGSYTVRLTVTDSAGQSDSQTETLEVSAAPAGCSGCTEYSGTLNGSGDSDIHPEGGFDFPGGMLSGELVGPSSADFDLRLQRYGCGFLFGCTWSNVASATTSSSNESISYNASSGTYRWLVESYAGSGSYLLTATPQ